MIKVNVYTHRVRTCDSANLLVFAYIVSDIFWIIIIIIIFFDIKKYTNRTEN